MAEPFLSEIRMMSFAFAPSQWARCDGQLLPIAQNQALFSLLGTTFGGDGRTNFGLPDLRGRVPIHVGQGHTVGERGGQQAHSLTIAELPTHTHGLQVSGRAGTSATPGSSVVLASASDGYALPASLTSLALGTVSLVGASQAHLNMQPFLTVGYCIALAGIFPSPT